MREKNPFPTEIALCAAFIEAVDQRLWQPYAETAGWDILLVRRADGFQIGIQAKLTLTAAAIAQTIETIYGWRSGVGPDVRAVLFPSGHAVSGTEEICRALGIAAIGLRQRRPGVISQPIWPPLPSAARGDDYSLGDWPRHYPVRRHRLPDYVPDVAAGASAPVQLTPWKIQALRLCYLMERNGFITRADFHAMKVDHRRWVTGEWLARGPAGWVKGPFWPDFPAAHPKTFAEIAADYDSGSKRRRPSAIVS